MEVSNAHGLLAFPTSASAINHATTYEMQVHIHASTTITRLPCERLTTTELNEDWANKSASHKGNISAISLGRRHILQSYVTQFSKKQMPREHLHTHAHIHAPTNTQPTHR